MTVHLALAFAFGARVALGQAPTPEPRSNDYILAIMDERDSRYNQRFDAQEKAVAAALAAQKEAVIKAEIATENRFQSVNEFRASLGDVSRLQLPRAEAEIRFSVLDERLTRLANQQTENTGKSTGRGEMIAVGGVALGLVIGLLGWQKRRTSS